VTLLLLPFVFAFQEYLTYQAWWHRTTPIVLSTFIFILVGARMSRYLKSKRLEHGSRSLIGISSFLLVVTSMGNVSQSLVSINTFRGEWDRGNVLGIGSPIENNADYNVINFLRIAPYTNYKWQAQERVLEGLPIDLEFQNPDGTFILNEQPLIFSQLTVRIGVSPFVHELQHFIRYQLVLINKTATDTTLRVTDADGSRLLKITGGETHNVVGRAKISEEIVISYVNPVELISLNVSRLQIGFSGELREKFRLTDEDWVTMK